MEDIQYARLPRPAGELDHGYGPKVHLLSQPYPMSMLARLCAAETRQPEINRLVATLYDWLLGEVTGRVLATRTVSIESRMKAYNAEGVYTGEMLDPDQKVVVVDIARAGILPAMRFYDGLNHLLDPDKVRQDHVLASRVADASGQVTGVAVESSKIGGPVEDATIFIPDPMAATGTSVSEVIRQYLEEVPGTPRRVVTVHLIVTPQYLAEISRRFPEVEIFAVRLDRGMSPADVLQTRPGDRWSEESGLNARDYIVPGGGGFGEIMNNAWV